MTAAAYGTLDVTDDRQVTEYERHFYDAYAGLADNKLVRLIWERDDARQRLRTRIPYSDQVIYSARDTRGRLAVAMAVNLRYPAEFQAAAFGFPRAGGAKARYCEILNVITTVHHSETARAIGTVGHPAAGMHHDHENLFYEVRNSSSATIKIS